MVNTLLEILNRSNTVFFTVDFSASNYANIVTFQELSPNFVRTLYLGFVKS